MQEWIPLLVGFLLTICTGLFVARIMASAPFELGTATRYFAVPWWASR